MSLLARVLTPVLGAVLGLVAVPAPAAHATHGCTAGVVPALLSNPYDPIPKVTVIPLVIDTTGTFDYLLYDAGVLVGVATCSTSCALVGAVTIGTNPHDPTPVVTPVPLVVDTTPTFTYAFYDVAALDNLLDCLGWHDIAIG